MEIIRFWFISIYRVFKVLYLGARKILFLWGFRQFWWVHSEYCEGIVSESFWDSLILEVVWEILF